MMSGNKRNKGRKWTRSKLGLELEEAFKAMAAHLRGEIEIPVHESGDALTPKRINAIRQKVAASTKEFEKLFGISARTMESYEQGRRRLDGAMQALLRIIEREPEAARRAPRNRNSSSTASERRGTPRHGSFNSGLILYRYAV